MRFPIACGAAIGFLTGSILVASAQQPDEATSGNGSLPMLFSRTPESSAAIAQLPQTFELPTTFPSIPSGVAVIPPSDGRAQHPQVQTAPTSSAPPPAAPVTVVPAPTAPKGAAPPSPTPLPTTTPLPPADVATPLVPPTIPPTQTVQPGQTPQAVQPPSSAPASGPRAAPAPSARTERPAAAVTLPAPVAYPTFAGTADGNQQIIRLRDMGSLDGVHLEGVASEGGVRFSARQDDAFIAARISLMFTYSPAVGRDDGELSAFLNGELLGSVALGKSRAPKSRTEFTFNPALLTTDNRLQFRFALRGQGANACKVARDKAIWVRIAPTSFVYLSATRLPLPDDLAFLPRPFVDPKDPLPLTLPFVLPPSPEAGVVQAAGIVAGYFGTIAQNKGISFPVMLSGLPAGNAVVLVQGDRYPAGIASIPGQGPRVAVISNPSQVDSKLLLIIGANAAELQTAAATLALGASRLTGGWSVAREELPPPRKPYDAPRWILTDHPVPLGDLVNPPALNGRRISDTVRVSFRTAPDLFFGALSGGTLNLRLHRSDDTWIDARDSRVSIDLNQKVIDEVPMEPKLKVLSRLTEWLFPGKADDRVSPVLLPGYQLVSANHLSFLFDLRAVQNADCANLEWSDRTGIDPDSSINLTRVAHFAAFPNLTLFANAGFPFTRLADLSDTAFVLPDASSPEEVQAFLNLLGTMAAATGVPATRYTVVTAEHVNTVSDRNLIVMGLDSSQPLLRQWERFFSVHITGDSVTTAPKLNFLQRLSQPFDPRAPYYDGAAVELAKSRLGKPYSYMASFWSPLNANRIVVAIGATQGVGLIELSKQMDDSEISSKIEGDFFFLSDGKGEFYTSGRRKFVGSLPIWWRIQWLAGSYGLAAFVCVICATILFAVAIRRFSAHRATRLLAGYR